jgi:hypothetical protein
MDKAKLQAWFDEAWNGLKAQDWKPSMSNDGINCRYRGTGGRKCAVGHLLSGEEAERFDLLDCLPGIDAGFTVRGYVLRHEEAAFLARLQIAHDTARSLDMRTKMRTLAKSEGLTVPND